MHKIHNSSKQQSPQTSATKSDKEAQRKEAARRRELTDQSVKTLRKLEAQIESSASLSHY